MKNLITLTGLLFSVILNGCVSLPTATDKQIQPITKVVDVNGKSKDQLYDESKIWIAKNFKSANSVIQYENKTDGKILGKGAIPFPCEGFIDCSAFGKDKVNFTIQIETKDNKARIVVSDFSATSLTYVQGGINNIGRERPIQILEHQQRVDKKMRALIEQYKSDITSVKTESNW